MCHYSPVRVAFIVNPLAGRGRALRVAAQALHEVGLLGLKVELLATEASGQATELARSLGGQGWDVVFAVGGDGTINEVVQGLVGTKTIFGVIPAGLANVWAADVGLSAKPGSVTALLTSGLVFDTDMGIVNGRYFLVMAGIGFDAEVVGSVTSREKARWHQAAYVYRAVRSAVGWAPVNACVSLDGKASEFPFFGAVASNTNRYAGVFNIAPDSRLDDGLLDVVVLRDGGGLQRLRSMAMADARWRKFDSCAQYERVERLDVTTVRPLPVHVDAEMAGATPCVVEVMPRSLPVLLPASAAGRYLRPGRPAKLR